MLLASHPTVEILAGDLDFQTVLAELPLREDPKGGVHRVEEGHGLAGVRQGGISEILFQPSLTAANKHKRETGIGWQLYPPDWEVPT